MGITYNEYQREQDRQADLYMHFESFCQDNEQELEEGFKSYCDDEGHLDIWEDGQGKYCSKLDALWCAYCDEKFNEYWSGLNEY